MTGVELPESGQPKGVEDGDKLKDRPLPTCDLTNPAALEAFYGPGGFVDHLRKVCLANCKEIIRAEFGLANAKVTETRLDDLARLHDNYLDFLTRHLEGRQQREEQMKQALGMGA